MKPWIFVTGVAFALTAAISAAAEKKVLGEGEGVFRAVDLRGAPSVPIAQALSSEARAALGIAAQGPFTLSQIDAPLVLLEFFNVHCFACALQAPVLDEAWRLVQAREDLRERVRFLGIGVGNTAGEVERYREQYEVPFPLVADPEFAVYDALGSTGGTPLIVIVPRRSAEGAGPRAQIGLIRDVARIVGEIDAALSGVPPAGDGALLATGQKWRDLPVPLGEEELTRRLRAAGVAAGLVAPKVTRLVVGGEPFWRLEGAEKGGVLWAKAAGRSKVCNVCHDIFFILIFDDTGRVVRFEPIHITKYKNRDFDEKDVAFLRSRVEGRLIGQEISFDPQVDAVSTATMSSALVFDTVRRLREAFEQIRAMTPAHP